MVLRIYLPLFYSIAEDIKLDICNGQYYLWITTWRWLFKTERMLMEITLYSEHPKTQKQNKTKKIHSWWTMVEKMAILRKQYFSKHSLRGGPGFLYQKPNVVWHFTSYNQTSNSGIEQLYVSKLLSSVHQAGFKVPWSTVIFWSSAL